MSPSDYKFEGWVGKDPGAAKGNMVWTTYEPKPFEETDVDIEITHCGVCGSDLHTLRSGWAPTNYPCVVGHEIIGHAVRVGSQVEGIKVGDRVGVGAQSSSCLNQAGDCEACADGLEPHCPHATNTYDSKWPDGSKAYGGYAKYWRGQGDFVFQIPDGIPSDQAAPMLWRYHGVFAADGIQSWARKKVGIIGIGGLGHFSIMGAAALGCDEVVAISRSSSKKADAMKMGATAFIATDEEKDWASKYANTLNLIISTVSSPKMPISDYLGLLRLRGQYVQVGAPEDMMPAFNMFSLIPKRAGINGSLIGGRDAIKTMLKLFEEKGVRTWNVNVPMKDANQALLDFEAGKPRYRYVLVA